MLSNLAAFIILKADKIRKKKLYVLFILSPMLRPKPVSYTHLGASFRTRLFLFAKPAHSLYNV